MRARESIELLMWWGSRIQRLESIARVGTGEALLPNLPAIEIAGPVAARATRAFDRT
jgi:hypothetical protein